MPKNNQAQEFQYAANKAKSRRGERGTSSSQRTHLGRVSIRYERAAGAASQSSTNKPKR